MTRGRKLSRIRLGNMLRSWQVEKRGHFAYTKLMRRLLNAFRRTP